MIKIHIDHWFRLPRLGSEAFRKVTREAHLKYDKQKGFLADQNTDLTLVASILKSIGEEVAVEVSCYICGQPAECPECAYNQICDRTIVSPTCICPKCLGDPDAQTLYAMRVEKEFES
jgi:hypothetical protein